MVRGGDYPLSEGRDPVIPVFVVGAAEEEGDFGKGAVGGEGEVVGGGKDDLVIGDWVEGGNGAERAGGLGGFDGGGDAMSCRVK